MLEFWQALWDPANEILRLALGAGLLVSIACGVMGSYVVTRRITYIADGVAHSVLGGIGLAGFLFVLGVTWLQPMVGALVAGLVAAGVIGIVSLRAKQREDTVISAIWAIGMAAGLLFIKKTPGYAVDPMSYLFGDILLVSPRDLWIVIGVDLLVIVFTFLFWKQLLAVSFDSDFARLRGIRVELFYLLMLGLTALTVVSLVNIVGIVLMIALLALPAAAASHFVRALWQMMILATLFSALFIILGLALSYRADLPSGATIALISGGFYLLTAIGSRLDERRRRAV